MKPKPSYATLQRKIRQLQADMRQWINAWSEQGFAVDTLKSDNTHLSSLLQAYKDRETDKAHRIIRSNPC